MGSAEFRYTTGYAESSFDQADSTLWDASKVFNADLCVPEIQSPESKTAEHIGPPSNRFIIPPSILGDL